MRPDVTPRTITSVGNYAITIIWNDGHSTGIYSFEHFRRICPCEECKKEHAVIHRDAGTPG